MWHDWLICVTWLIDEVYVTHWHHVEHLCAPDVRCISLIRDSFICDMTQWHMWRDSLTRSMLLIDIMSHTCAQTISRSIWRIHDSFICDMTHSYVWRDSLMRSMVLIDIISHTCSWLVHMWHDLFICVTWLIDAVYGAHWQHITHLFVTRSYVTWLIHMRDVTHWWGLWCSLTAYQTLVYTLYPHSHDSFMSRSYVTWLIHAWHD